MNSTELITAFTGGLFVVGAIQVYVFWKQLAVFNAQLLVFKEQIRVAKRMFNISRQQVIVARENSDDITYTDTEGGLGEEENEG